MKRNIFPYFLLITTLIAGVFTGCATTSEVAEETTPVTSEVVMEPEAPIEATPVLDVSDPIPVVTKESVIEYAAPFAYVLEYPSYGVEVLDTQIADFVFQLQADFTSQYQKKQFISDLDETDVEHTDSTQETDTPPTSESETSVSQEDCSIFMHLSYESNVVHENLLSITFFESQVVQTVPLTLEKIHTLHYDIRTGERLWETDFIDSTFAGSITEYVIAYFQETEPFAEKWAARDDFATKFEGETYQQFAFAEDGLLIHFPAYTFLPYNFGTTTVTIPYSEIDGLVIDLDSVTEEKADATTDDNDDEETTVTPVMVSADIANRDIDPNKPMVALTFDDGPHPVHTEAILDVLAEYNVVATFFELGSLVESYPEVVRRQVALGSELGNHSYSHKNFNILSAEEIAEDYALTSKAFLDAVGFTPTLFRPPYGYCNDFVQKNIPIACVTWSLDTLDWESRDTDKILETIAETEDLDGSVILMHDIYETTVEAVEILVPELIADGYQFVTVSELFSYRFGITPEAGKLYGYAYLSGLE
ncbi:polysaccharide deacetylase family protein [Chakrabartyella piscis]|uniref:polysaccharide deacetylase family protein n=1 Tax=Chakrabartyella piscis TaxID=2918914 RepID=UPI002958D0BC|nr:polysaccharide deacetylase family protein [Chakrabartyella piscis]